MNHRDCSRQLFCFLLISTLMLSGLSIHPLASSQPSVAVIRPKSQDKVASDVVNVDVSVVRGSGEVITDLKRSSFAVFLDGVQKEITDFSTPDRPIMASLIVEDRNWGLPIDNKGIEGLEVTPPQLLQVAELLVTHLIKSPQDQVSVVAASMWPQTITNLTHDSKRIVESFDALRKHAPVAPEIALFDTLKLVSTGGTGFPPFLDKLKERKFNYVGLASAPGKRRAIILVSSGVDTLSKTSYKQISRVVQDAGVPIYVICTTGTLDAKLAKWLAEKRAIAHLPKDIRRDESQLNTIAVDTGGVFLRYSVETDGPAIVQNIKAMLSSQYNLTFNASDTRDGKSHKIEVKVDIDGDGTYDQQTVLVQARQVYNAPKK